MVEIINRQSKSRIRTDRYAALLERLLRRARLKNADVVLVFAGDAFVRRLNRVFRRKDRTTDVLSFPVDGRGEGGRRHLGDIVISVPQARRQAVALGHSLDAELAFLAIHGFLHLCGYEHEAGHEEEEARVLRLLRREKFGPLPAGPGE
ncbi:MAG: rRNA maturation RNase YbeY [Acidobacteriota bacterium]|nr:rRNA maturation RNase YbeY [Acidobacteriota bacterium]MDD8039834.1 rRNA maturation RNase YbeY [Acidobacteriota bacterium]